MSRRFDAVNPHYQLNTLMTNTDSIWVIDPATSQQVDVRPFLNMLHAFDRKPATTLSSGGQAVTQRLMRLLNITVHDHNVIPAVQLVSIYHDLHLLDDMFRDTATLPVGQLPE